MKPPVVAALAAVALAASAAVAAGGGVPGWEAALLWPFNDLPDGLRPVLVPVMVLGTFVAPVAVGALVAVATRRARPAADVVVAGLLAYWSAMAVKAVVGRDRPGVLLEDVTVRDLRADGVGFVSGHASVAVAIAAALVPSLPRGGQVAVAGLAAVVGLARLYEGVHLPLDVIGGAAVGVLSGLAGRALLDRLDRDPAPTGGGGAHPGGART